MIGQGVEAIAAVDAYRSVHREGDEVGTWTTVDVGERCVGIVRVDLDEGPHGEGVVVFFAEQEQFGEVAVDGEVVFAEATVDCGRVADAVGQIALGDRRSCEVVLGGKTIVGVGAVTRRLEDLADLEDVIASIAVDDHRCQVVVETKVSSPARPLTITPPLMSPS